MQEQNVYQTLKSMNICVDIYVCIWEKFVYMDTLIQMFMCLYI